MKISGLILSLTIICLFLIPIAVDAQPTGQVSTPMYQYEKPGDGVLRVLSYNVRNCLGMDGKIDYIRVSRVIKSIHPTVVALQELDSVTTRSNGTDVLKVLAENCGMNYTYGASIPYRGGKYGIGILSSEKPLKSSFIPLPGREEKRGLLIAEFENYVLFCTHFSLTEADRVASVELINHKAKDYQKHVILAGDLNTKPESGAISTLSSSWINLAGTNPTFPSNGPRECIDYIFGLNCCGLNYSVLKGMVVPEAVASDHCPLFVDVKLK
jgi:endonuclease/exonuclease/phosphatase family metal-dependent hydrolase